MRGNSQGMDNCGPGLAAWQTRGMGDTRTGRRGLAESLIVTQACCLFKIPQDGAVFLKGSS